MKDPWQVKYMFPDQQTPEVCLAAVRQNGWVLPYIWNPSPQICLAAVLNDPKVLKYV
uniref:DUF4116 domain-containing protein n=1 Tax=viral metagenome TaxID=1070528 RepID=A0A6C0BNE3_9ZZZZ